MHCDLISCLKSIRALDGLVDHEYAWIAENGVHKHANPGEVIFREGDPATVMFFVLSGEVHLRHDRAAGQSLVIGRAAQVTGLLPFSRMKFYTGTALAVGTVCVLGIVHSSFDDMLNAIPTMNRRCVAILLDRAREVTRIEQQTEKLTALGKLAGNLAHELNNPASAVKIRQEICCMTSSVRNYYGVQSSRAVSRRSNSNSCISGRKSSPARTVVSSSLDDIDREDALTAWFEKAGFREDWWEVIPDLLEGGVLVEELGTYSEATGSGTPQSRCLAIILVIAAGVKKMGSNISSASGSHLRTQPRRQRLCLHGPGAHPGCKPQFSVGKYSDDVTPAFIGYKCEC